MRTPTRGDRPSRVAFVVALALAAALLSGTPALAQSSEPVKHRIEITDDGFNGRPDFTLEVEQGRVVELTFVFAQQHALGDSHVIVIRGLGLESQEINFYHPESTITFVADKPGTFELGCDLDCDIHAKLNKAHLKVKAATGGSAQGAAAALTATSLTAYPSAWEVSGGPVKVTATLKDANGAPVAKAPVRFLLATAFAGVQGPMEIGAAKTDANGTATITYKPTTAGMQQLTVRFDGMGLFAESEQSLQLQVRAAQPAYVVAPRGLEALSDRVPNAIVVILLCIWGTFGYVLWQVLRIGRWTAIPKGGS